MRDLIRIIKNVIFLRQANKDLSIIKGNVQNIMEKFLIVARSGKLTQLERNLLASLIMKLRKENPYEVQGWSESQKMYEDYFKMDRHIASYEELKEKFAKGDVYVTRFRDEAPVKGERFSEYSTNIQCSHEQGRVYKIKTFKSYGVEFEDDNDYASLNEDWITAYLYSTTEEMEQFEREKAERDRIKKLIEEKQKELSNLYSQLY